MELSPSLMAWPGLGSRRPAVQERTAEATPADLWGLGNTVCRFCDASLTEGGTRRDLPYAVQYTRTTLNHNTIRTPIAPGCTQDYP